MPTAAVKRYWDSLPDECVCGRTSEHVHHIIHVNGQRITKDDWLVVKLCALCHQLGKLAVHVLGGERQFLEATGWDLVHLSILRRHNYEVRRG
jgi:hypothetical protein